MAVANTELLEEVHRLRNAQTTHELDVQMKVRVCVCVFVCGCVRACVRACDHERQLLHQTGVTGYFSNYL